MDKEEKKIHVLYYKVGSNVQGLSRIMQQLRKLYGNKIIALPKDVTELSRNDLSINDLLSIRTAINLLIMDKLSDENTNPDDVPDMRSGAVMPPMAGRIPPQQNIPPKGAPQQNMMQRPGNLRPGGGYQPQNGPQRPPDPPTSGSNAVKPPIPRVSNSGFIKDRDFVPPPPTLNK